MAEVGILDAIQEQIEQEREKIIQAASQQADEILQRAEADVKRIEEVIAERKKAMAKEAQVKRVSPLALQVKQDGMNQAFANALKELNGMRGKGGYAQVLEKLTGEACRGFGAAVQILVNPADVQAAKQVAAKMEIQGEVKGRDDIAGGVVVTSQDGRILNHNTFASRCEKIKLISSGEVAGILYAD